MLRSESRRSGWPRRISYLGKQCRGSLGRSQERGHVSRNRSVLWRGSPKRGGAVIAVEKDKIVLKATDGEREAMAGAGRGEIRGGDARADCRRPCRGRGKGPPLSARRSSAKSSDVKAPGLSSEAQVSHHL